VIDLGEELRAGGAVARSGLLKPVRPDRAVRMAAAFRRFNPFAATAAAAAARDPEGTAIVDERGAVSFAELHGRTNALANAWRERGIGPGSCVAILCRNHRGFADAAYACSKIGARTVFLNTDHAGPQLADVATREGADALVYDESLAGHVEGLREELHSFAADTGPGAGPETLEGLIAEGDRSDPPKPDTEATIVMLTSGTTGRPKGAPRQEPSGATPLLTLLSKVPIRTRESTMIAAPLFHALGFAHLSLAVGFGSTAVLRRRFDAAETVRLTAQHGCTGLIAVPIMLQRILELGPEELSRCDLSRLRIIFSAGSALSADLAIHLREQFGDIVYNLYGSTECAVATIATPEDLAAAPGTAGRTPYKTQVRILDADGSPLPQGQTGRIFIHSGLSFEGYSDGGGKEVIDGYMSSGDMGHLDQAGRLFVDGRDDDMIVSGGENLFPAEIEELLVTHPTVAEVAVIGVPDEKFGKRLAAFVVPAAGTRVDEDELKDFVKANLARFKTPREINIVEELPRNPLGKVLKGELA
jgi:acyl-CoA synthetase (AMP-forming)/AMP-acid ligase II